MLLTVALAVFSSNFFLFRRYVEQKMAPKAKSEPSRAPAKRQKKLKDPNAPPKPQSAYMLWSQRNRASVKSSHPDLDFEDLGRKLGEIWRTMSEADKKVPGAVFLFYLLLFLCVFFFFFFFLFGVVRTFVLIFLFSSTLREKPAVSGHGGPSQGGVRHKERGLHQDRPVPPVPNKEGRVFKQAGQGQGAKESAQRLRALLQRCM